VYGEFVNRFVERAKALRIGDGLEPTTDMGPLINEAALEKVSQYVAIGKNEGAKLSTGGNRLTDGAHAKGWFHEATIFSECDP
jgi:acyl-CoA reductase-like NAD-dependent aldehyde dehydrogenase